MFIKAAKRKQHEAFIDNLLSQINSAIEQGSFCSMVIAVKFKAGELGVEKHQSLRIPSGMDSITSARQIGLMVNRLGSSGEYDGIAIVTTGLVARGQCESKEQIPEATADLVAQAERISQGANIGDAEADGPGTVSVLVHYKGSGYETCRFAPLKGPRGAVKIGGEWVNLTELINGVPVEEKHTLMDGIYENPALAKASQN